MKRNFTYIPVIGTAFLMLAAGCAQNEASPGVEYMPDMYRSPAIEAYVDYGQDPFYVGDEKAQEQRETPSARKPVAGTIAFSEDADMAWVNFPYQYPNTPDGYNQAGMYLKNPIELNEQVFNEGKAIYGKFCDHCHGEEGGGDGKIVTNGNFPPVPAYNGIADLNEGKMFHTLTYGKGNMGSHASQLDKAERWKVIHYIRSFQTGMSLEQMMAEQDSMSNMGATPTAEQIEVDGVVYFRTPDGNVYDATGTMLTAEQVTALNI